MATISKINEEIEIEIKNFNFYYSGSTKANLNNINMPIVKNSITALIGPSGCGKTTLLRSFNRMHDLYPKNRYEGKILFNKENILSKGTDLIDLRVNIGMIFQKPTAFPMSIFDNIAYGLKLKGIKDKAELKQRVIHSLKEASLYKEVKDRLDHMADGLSGGQQQRLCIARAIAVEPNVLLFDEPTSALDPISTEAIEKLILKLKKHITIVIVTHNMQQAARISDYTAFMYMGELIELSKTQKIFLSPKEKLTEQYITGKFG